MTIECPECGGPLHCGDFPFCHGDPTKHVPAAAGVIGDECTITQENGFRTPQRFTSKKALAAALAARGLETRVRHVTVPGTDKSPFTTDWSKGSIDAKTLANAAALVARAGEARTSSSAGEGSPDVPVIWQISEKVDA